MRRSKTQRLLLNQVLLTHRSETLIGQINKNRERRSRAAREAARDQTPVDFKTRLKILKSDIKRLVDLADSEPVHRQYAKVPADLKALIDGTDSNIPQSSNTPARSEEDILYILGQIYIVLCDTARNGNSNSANFRQAIVEYPIKTEENVFEMKKWLQSNCLFQSSVLLRQRLGHIVQSLVQADHISANPSQHHVPQMPSTSQEMSSTSQQGPSTSQQGPSTSQQGPSTSQQGPSTSQEMPSTSQQGPSTSDQMPSTSQQGPSTSQQMPSTSDQMPRTSEQMPTTSQQIRSIFQQISRASAPQNLTSVIGKVLANIFPNLSDEDRKRVLNAQYPEPERPQRELDFTFFIECPSPEDDVILKRILKDPNSAAVIELFYQSAVLINEILENYPGSLDFSSRRSLEVPPGMPERLVRGSSFSDHLCFGSGWIRTRSGAQQVAVSQSDDNTQVPQRNQHEPLSKKPSLADSIDDERKDCAIESINTTFKSDIKKKVDSREIDLTECFKTHPRLMELLVEEDLPQNAASSSEGPSNPPESSSSQAHREGPVQQNLLDPIQRPRSILDTLLEEDDRPGPSHRPSEEPQNRPAPRSRTHDKSPSDGEPEAKRHRKE